MADRNIDLQTNYIKLILHLVKILPEFDARIFQNKLNKDLFEFLTLHNNDESEEWIKVTYNGEVKSFIEENLQATSEIMQYFNTLILENENQLCDEEGKLYYYEVYDCFEQLITTILIDIFYICHYSHYSLKVEYKKLMIDIHIKKLQELINSDTNDNATN